TETTDAIWIGGLWDWVTLKKGLIFGETVPAWHSWRTDVGGAADVTRAHAVHIPKKLNTATASHDVESCLVDLGERSVRRARAKACDCVRLARDCGRHILDCHDQACSRRRRRCPA